MRRSIQLKGVAMRGEMRVYLSEEGVDAEHLGMLTGFLRHELLELDVGDVTALPGGDPPPGSRGIDPVTVGGLLVTFRESAEGLRTLVSAIRNWLRRGDSAGRHVRLVVGGDELEVFNSSAEDQERLIEVFISRHAAGGGERWPASE